MKIAVASRDERTVADHVGHCDRFLVYEVSQGTVQGKECRHLPGAAEHQCGNRALKQSIELSLGVLSGGATQVATETPSVLSKLSDCGGSGLAELLSDCQVLICQGMGKGLRGALQGQGIAVVFTDEAEADAAVAKHLDGTLGTFEETHCDCAGH